MNAQSRLSLSSRIQNFFIDEIKKTCGEDYPLIEDRIPELVNMESLRESICQARAAIVQRKREASTRQQ